MKLDQETAEAVVRLANSRDFALFMVYLDKLNTAFVAQAINGTTEDYSPEVLRGRAQAMAIIKQELEKAPDLVGRIQKVS